MPATRSKPTVRIEEANLVARARANDADAVRTIMQRNNRRLFRMARSIIGDDAEAEDVVQEAYGRAFTSLGAFRGEASLGTWLGRIVINEALGRVRRARPTVELSTVEPLLADAGNVVPFPSNVQPDPERTMAQRQIQTLLEQAIDNLPAAFRTVLVLRIIEGMSVEETAQMLAIRQETVKTRLHRARALLRAALEQDIGPVLMDAFPFEGLKCERLTDNVLKRLGLSS